MKKSKNIKTAKTARKVLTGLGLLSIVMLSGCSAMHPPSLDYNHVDNVPTDAVSQLNVLNAKERAALQAQLKSLGENKNAVVTSYGFEDDASVEKAYNNYIAGSDDGVVRSNGFITYPYDAYSRPIIVCAPLRVCTIQLEKGEKIRNIQIGDSSRWTFTTFLTGPNENDGSYSIAFKPTSATKGLNTDLVISTDKRIYTLGLESKLGAATHVVNFYYPKETIDKFNERMMAQALNNHYSHANDSDSSNSGSNSSNDVNPETTVVQTNNINRNYIATGDSPTWKPIEVFDDGVKTFIKLPKIASRSNIPVVKVVNAQGEEALSNGRYKQPYYILDGLYQKIMLTSGTGANQQKVVITNNNVKA
ncbi:MAG: TrbG/VirB9 family P-type conjugative transfer protein [Proteobacteria bacterium]|nr:TrbG/VirB9 family P-type conjugative transfer protein [Pseudomonadota bacterium]